MKIRFLKIVVAPEAIAVFRLQTVLLIHIINYKTEDYEFLSKHEKHEI